MLLPPRLLAAASTRCPPTQDLGILWSMVLGLSPTKMNKILVVPHEFIIQFTTRLSTGFEL